MKQKLARLSLKSQVGEQGFTLIEILIAIAILSFMALGVFQIVSQSTDTAEKVTVEDDEFVQIVAALKKFERDFTTIYSPLYFSAPKGVVSSDDEEQDSYDKDPDKLPINQKYKEHNLYDGTTEDGHPIPAIFYEKNTEIIFFTSGHRRKYEDEKESTFSWVRYFLSSNPDNSELQILYRQEIGENIFSSELDWGAFPAFPIINNIVKIEFFFWDQKKEEWSDSISEDAKYLGQSIKIHLIWQDINGNENPEVKTYRILWPEFDPIEDLKKKLAAKKGSNNSRSNTRTGFNNQNIDDEEASENEEEDES